MATLTREELKTKFKNGLIPTEKNFCDLIESTLNKSDDNFFGQWRAGNKYCLNDVVIHGNTFYRLKKGEKSAETPTAKTGAKPLARTAQPPSENETTECFCSSTPPDCDAEHWEKLEFDLKDKDWDYNADNLWAMTPTWKVGIGTDKPEAKFHVTEEQRGRLLVNPIAPLPHENAHTPTNAPELRLERDLVKDCDLCYLSVRLEEETTRVETSANKGFSLLHASDPTKGADILAVVTPNGTGVGTADPKAAFAVHTKNLGDWEVNPHGSTVAAAKLTSLKTGNHHAQQTIDESFNVFSTNAQQGFKFLATNKNGNAPPLVIDENGRLGIGTDSPKCILEVVNPACGKALIALDTPDPALSIVNTKPTGKNSYLTIGADNSFAVLKTDAECGFVFKHGQLFDPAQSATPEKELTGEPQVYIDQHGKVGIGASPNQFELDVLGKTRAGEMYQNTNENTIREVGKIEDALDVICRLTPIAFEWKTPGTTLSKREQFGLRANECANWAPQVVNDLGKGDINIAYQNLVPLLIKAIQEQQKLIEDLMSK